MSPFLWIFLMIYVDISILSNPLAKFWSIYLGSSIPPEIKDQYRYRYQDFQELKAALLQDQVDNVRIYATSEVPESKISELEAMILEVANQKDSSDF